MNFIYSMTNSNPASDFSIIDKPVSPITENSSPKSAKSLPDLTNMAHQSISNHGGAPPSLTMSSSDENLYISSPSDISDNDNTFEQSPNPIYVISRDGNPISYCITKAEANVLIWKLAKRLRSKQTDYSYNYYLCTDCENRVTLYGMYKNWLLSYDRNLGSFSYLKIPQIN